MRILIILATALVFALAGCEDTGKPVAGDAAKGESEGEVSEVATLLAKFAPTEIGVEDAGIPEKHRGVIKKLVEAAKIIDDLFLLQVDSRNKTWRAEIAGDPKLGTTLAVFDIM